MLRLKKTQKNEEKGDKITKMELVMENIIRTEIENHIADLRQKPDFLFDDMSLQQLMTDSITCSIVDELDVEFDELSTKVNEMLDEYEDELDELTELCYEFGRNFMEMN